MNKDQLRKLIREEVQSLMKSNQVSECDITSKYIQGDISLSEYKNHINEIVSYVDTIGINEDLSAVNKWFDDNILSKVNSISIALAGKIDELSEQVVNKITYVIKTIIKLVSKFSKKYPKLFKMTVVLAAILALILVIGASNLYASTGGGDESIVIFDTMVGLLDIFKESIMNDLGVSGTDISEAKLYIQDLKDGKLDVGEATDSVEKIHKAVEALLKYLSEEVSDGRNGKRVMNLLKRASDIGKNTTIKTMKGLSIGPDGDIEFGG